MSFCSRLFVLEDGAKSNVGHSDGKMLSMARTTTSAAGVEPWKADTTTRISTRNGLVYSEPYQ